jgi:hypothetical protein
MAISQSITVLPTPPSRADPDNFDARADGFLGALPTMQTQMNTWAGQANSTATTVNNDKLAAQSAKTGAESARDTASGHASTAAGHASTATTQAGTATTQAGIATTQAGIATTQAGVATTQAGLATTARQGAEAARDDAVSIVYGAPWPVGVSMTEVGYLDGVTSAIQSQLNGKAASAAGVTNGDSHDHSGGDGAQIAYANLSGTPTLGTAAAAATSDFAAASHNQAETTITFTDVSTGNASTTAHGYAPKATAPASGLVSVLAIGNGETVRSDKALFDTTNPAALGTVGPGTAVVAARRDHVHAMPSAANVGAASASSFIAGAGALTGPAAPLTIGTAAAAATGDFAPAAKGVTNGDSHNHNGGDGAQIAYANLSGLPTLGTAAATASTAYAPAAQGVTNGNSHDHNGGDGGQIAYSSLSGLPALGKVLQVIADQAHSTITVSSDSWTAVGLSASITPSSINSKILVLMTIPVDVSRADDTQPVGASVRLLRGGTVIRTNSYTPFVHYRNIVASTSINYLDEPATTSAITYAVEINQFNAYSTVKTSNSSGPGSLILMEIAP